MKLKKILISVLALGILASCGNDNAEVNQESIAENKDTNIENESAISEEDYSDDEYEQIVEPVVQTVQEEQGNKEESNYFSIDGDFGIYQQIGDVSISKLSYNDENIIIIPLNITNKTDKAVRPADLIINELMLVQEDKSQMSSLTISTTMTDDIEQDNSVEIKPGENIDFYLSYKVKDINLDYKLISMVNNDIVLAEFKN